MNADMTLNGLDGLEAAWTIIANAYGGDWESAPDEWRAAAERWRDEIWHPALDASRVSPDDPPAGSNPPEGERGLREALVFYADADNYVGGEVGWWGSDRLGEPVWCMDFGSIARNALAAARVSTEGPAGSDPENPYASDTLREREAVCRACGGSGHRNGSLRAADPFGTCPGCDGTGVQDRDAAHQFPTQHGFAVTVARALESAAEAVRRERLRIVDLIGSEFPDSMPLLAGDVIGMLQADFLDRAAQR